MCGILGVASAMSPVDSRQIALMLDTLRHRGPDDSGEWSSGDGVELGHRRLAIIDLSPAGHQPMADGSGTLHVTFNGEIYNYRDLRRELAGRGHPFHTASDTEVLLAAYRQWGTRCVERLNGMFAFALYDAAKRELFLARDRAGEKPLFYHHSGGRFTFASELKAIMADRAFDRTLDLQSLDYYLAFGYVTGDRTMLSGVRKLRPAHALVYDLARDSIREWRYWDLPNPFSGDAADPNALTDELEALLEDAVRLQLVADVPVGVLLSGGIDSSLVTALAARVSSSPVRTFTIAFPGHAEYDEGPYARLVASHFGTEHHELVAEPATVDLLPMLARQYDDPIADSSMVPTYLVSRLIRQHATVALGGDGGDELFGGYSLYPLVIRQQRVRRAVPHPVRWAVSATARRLPVGFRGRTYLHSFALDPLYGVAHTGLYFDRHTRTRLVPALRRTPAGAPELFRMQCARRGLTTIQQLTAADFGSYLPDDILVKVDRASMLTSLEVRAPFLDHRIISFAYSRVPDRLRATATERKVLLRRLAARLLPPALDLRRKQGFSLPLHKWFAGEWGTYLEGLLRESPPALYDRKAVDEIVSAQRRGYSNTQRIFTLAMLELWRRAYDVRIPA